METRYNDIINLIEKLEEHFDYYRLFKDHVSVSFEAKRNLHELDISMALLSIEGCEKKRFMELDKRASKIIEQYNSIGCYYFDQFA